MVGMREEGYTYAQIAHHLGRTQGPVAAFLWKWRRGWRRVDNPLTPSHTRPRRWKVRWTPQEINRLIKLQSDGTGMRDIARSLGRSRYSVYAQLYRLGYTPTQETLTPYQISRKMGVHNDLPYKWVGKGWLTARHSREQECWRVREEDFFSFLEDPRSWPYWSVGKVRDPGLRDWMEEIRSGDDWLSPSEASHIIHFHQETIREWIRRGLVRALRFPGASKYVVDMGSLRQHLMRGGSVGISTPEGRLVGSGTEAA